MIQTTINILIISLLLIYGNTISGFGENLKQWIWKKLLFPKYPVTILDRPFFCNLCLTFWVGIIVLLVTNQFTLPMVAIVAVISYLTDVTETLIRMAKDLIVNIVNQIYKLVDKLA